MMIAMRSQRQEEETTEKNATFPSNSQQVQTRFSNPSLFANMKIVKEASSQKKNEGITHQKISHGRKRVLRAFTSPDNRSPEASILPTLQCNPICKTAAKSKSESYVSRADMVINEENYKYTRAEELFAIATRRRSSDNSHS
ncbi:unnamed protein product [Onchocerca flexuosa]|uniref:TPX2_importin domain-containing protein n=1 Tax=Onchocerca flexuosa TaxID=387005 RepID=A0A183HLC2_9BILA|nr:unnamed protein product [Onchocerca flexuosa]